MIVGKKRHGDCFSRSSDAVSELFAELALLALVVFFISALTAGGFKSLITEEPVKLEVVVKDSPEPLAPGNNAFILMATGGAPVRYSDLHIVIRDENYNLVDTIEFRSVGSGYLIQSTMFQNTPITDSDGRFGVGDAVSFRLVTPIPSGEYSVFVFTSNTLLGEYRVLLE